MRSKLMFHETRSRICGVREGHGGGRLGEYMVEEIKPELSLASAECYMQLISLQSDHDISSLPLNRTEQHHLAYDRH